MSATINLSNTLSKSKVYDKSGWKPEIYDPRTENGKGKIRQLVNSANISVVDEIFGQVEELIKCLNPKKKYNRDELKAAAVDYLGDKDSFEIGNWVWYPWRNCLVHILGETDFIRVRTNRNHYKITPEEQLELSSKRIGLIGLSVGQSVAVTLAMERSFGELRLADFDELELTNLNRIRTGLINLGINKTISVAREIMEIDPYLNLKCFTSGLNEENMDDFFLGDGQLDLLIDECDGLDIKVLARHKAKELRIPVVMEASDRGMVDVERFDLEPERPLLHGLIGDLDPAKLKTLKTNQEKIPYMLDIVGLDTISTRAKASMLEIGETITTWPQLASAVTLGGGITADVVRRILLNQFSASGRFYMDVEKLIGDPIEENSLTNLDRIDSPPSAVDWSFSPSITPKDKLSKKSIKSIVKAACHAPSGGNLQPWIYHYQEGILGVGFNPKWSSDFLDAKNNASLIAIGASIENAILKAGELGFEADAQLLPLGENLNTIAEICFKKSSITTEEDQFLAENLSLRHTNRNIEPSSNIDPKLVSKLKDYLRFDDSEFIYIENPADKNLITDLMAWAEKFRIMHPVGHRDFVNEMRWTKEDAIRTGDGIDLETCDLNEEEIAGFRLARHPEVISKLKEWGGGNAFENVSRKATSNAAGLGFIMRPKLSSLDFIKAGMELERIWIAINGLGIGFQPQSALTLLRPRLQDGKDLNPTQATELKDRLESFDKVIANYSENIPVFGFRLFKGQKPVVKSFRRNLKHHFKD